MWCMVLVGERSEQATGRMARVRRTVDPGEQRLLGTAARAESMFNVGGMFQV